MGDDDGVGWMDGLLVLGGVTGDSGLIGSNETRADGKKSCFIVGFFERKI